MKEDTSGFEEAIRLAVSIGGDSDTIAAITGPMAEAYYGVPTEIRDKAMGFLPKQLASMVNKMYKHSNK